MPAQPGVLGETVAPARVALERRSRDHLFFTSMAVALAVVTFVGFAPSYFLRSYYGGEALSRLVHVHGMASTAWILLFLVQTSLVAARRVHLHRRLGVLGALLLAALLPLGLVTAIEAARHGVTPPGGPPPLAFLAVPIGTILSFTALAAAGVWYRRRPETHKRLMLLATIALVIPALARMRWLGGGGPPVAIAGSLTFLAMCLGYDRLANGRVHPAFAWGGLFLVLSIAARFGAARSAAWLPIAEWVVR